MSLDILRPCKHSGCNALTINGYCNKHITDKSGARYSASARGYGRKWQKARAEFLSAHPYCAECERNGVRTPATEVDHNVPHKGNQRLFWDQSNWQALCHSCHSRKTATEDGGSWVPPSPLGF